MERVVKSCKIYKEEDINAIADFILANSDQDFLSDISELLN